MMKKILLVCCLLLLSLAVRANENTALDFSFHDLAGKALELNQYKGKVILVVNTASQCIFTPQYRQLEQIYNEYRDRGLVVLGVPSPDFGRQEFSDPEKIKQFTEENYHISFPLSEPTDVVGADAHPFYRWVNQVYGRKATPKWNFYKYLINRHGELIAWFPSTTKPDSTTMRKAIEAALSEQVTAATS